MKINRRRFVITFFFGSIGFLFLDAFWIEKYIVRWHTYDISNSHENPIKVIQLTDLHIREEKPYHSWITKRINKEQPDLLFFTGDCINRTRHLPLLEAFVADIDKSIPKVVIMGNKEYDGGISPDMYVALFKKYNGRILVNEGFLFEKGNRKLNIVGIDDLVRGNPDYELAVKNIDTAIDTIVLNHCPQYRDDIDELNSILKVNIQLVLSGHTHGGQIQFLGKEFYKPGGSGRYLNGWYESNESKMYVSKGIGTSYLPIRFGARAEAPIFYL
ncbi:MAG: metallophosphoesterase [Eudoraea sp.]|nr:metallophosphoesterase [Eudoraea sp.]